VVATTNPNPAFIFVNPVIQLGPTASGIIVTCELTRAELTNDVSMVDTGSLCGPAQQPGRIAWTLDLEGYQGYDDGSLWMFLWDNQRAEVAFLINPRDPTVVPPGAGNPYFSGTVVCVPGVMGGTREEVASFSVSLPLVGDPVMAITAPVMAMSASAGKSED
jgi:hypothetical protein